MSKMMTYKKFVETAELLNSGFEWCRRLNAYILSDVDRGAVHEDVSKHIQKARNQLFRALDLLVDEHEEFRSRWLVDSTEGIKLFGDLKL